MFLKKKKEKLIERVQPIRPVPGQFVTFNYEEDKYCDAYVDNVFDTYYFLKTTKGFEVRCHAVLDDKVILHTIEGEPAMASEELKDMCNRRCQMTSQEKDISAEIEINKLKLENEEYKKQLV